VHVYIVVYMCAVVSTLHCVHVYIVVYMCAVVSTRFSQSCDPHPSLTTTNPNGGKISVIHSDLKYIFSLAELMFCPVKKSCRKLRTTRLKLRMFAF